MKSANSTIDHNTAALSQYSHVNYRGLTAGIRQTITIWRQRSAGRRALCQLSLPSLRDIGIRNDEVIFEADKPFWRK
jgi:uncharacterized protein YjiS (DUF1127 family)